MRYVFTTESNLHEMSVESCEGSNSRLQVVVHTVVQVMVHIIVTPGSG